MELIKPGTKIQFTKYRHVAVALSSLVNLTVLIFLFIHGPNLGVDFAGGTLVQLKLRDHVAIPLQRVSRPHGKNVGRNRHSWRADTR